MVQSVFQFNGAEFNREVGSKTECVIDLGQPFGASAGDMNEFREHIGDGIDIVAKEGFAWTAFQFELEKFDK